MRLEKYIEDQTEKDAIRLLEFSFLMNEEENILNEGIVDNINKFLKKLGLHIDATDTGILNVIMKGGKYIAQMIWYSLKALRGDKDAKEKVKEIANTKITKEDFANFILKLDVLTLHILTEPIHMIDAITGWHIGVNDKKIGDVTHRVKTAIKWLETTLKEIPSKAQELLSKHIEGLKRVFGFDNQ